MKMPSHIIIPTTGDEAEIRWTKEIYGTGRVEIALSGAAAEDVVRQIESGGHGGYSSLPPSRLEQDNKELLERVVKAEAHARACDEQVADYEGEIQFLRDELARSNKPDSGSLTAAGGWLAPSAHRYPAPGGTAAAVSGAAGSVTVNVVNPAPSPDPLSSEILKAMGRKALTYQTAKRQYDLDYYSLDGETL